MPLQLAIRFRRLTRDARRAAGGPYRRSRRGCARARLEAPSFSRHRPTCRTEKRPLETAGVRETACCVLALGLDCSVIDRRPARIAVIYKARYAQSGSSCAPVPGASARRTEIAAGLNFLSFFILCEWACPFVPGGDWRDNCEIVESDPYLRDSFSNGGAEHEFNENDWNCTGGHRPRPGILGISIVRFFRFTGHSSCLRLAY